MSQSVLAVGEKIADSGFGRDVSVSVPFAGRPPLMIEPVEPRLRNETDAACQWMVDNHAAIESALLKYGAILWRGFPIHKSGDFSGMMAGWPRFAQGYVGGGSDRKAIEGDVMESTRTSPDVYILLHQEMSYMPHNPRLIAFYCHVPADEGGNTVIGDMRGALEELPDELARRFRDHGLAYRRHLRNAEAKILENSPAHAFPTWQYWFNGSDRDQVSADLAARNIDYEWHDDGSMTIITHTPGVITHPVTGEPLLFNQLYTQFQHQVSMGQDRVDYMTSIFGPRENWPTSLAFGDGSPATDADFMAVHAVMEKRVVSFDWQAGDVMMLENKFTAHGRTPFKGDQRDVQVMLFE